MKCSLLTLREVLTSHRSGFWGVAPSENAAANVVVVRNGDVPESGTLRVASLPRRHFGPQEIAKARLCEADILMTTSGNTGRVTYVTDPTADDGLPLVASNFVRALRIDGQRVSPRYVYYALQAPAFRRLIARHSRGATIKNLSSRILEEPVLPVVTREKQERIVRLLDEADELRKLRAQADKRMADFIPSLFHEMFGDPITNPMGWPVKRLSEVCSVVSGLWTGKKPPYRTVNVVRNTNFRKGGRLSLEDVAEIQVEERQYESRSLAFGDLLLEKSGGGPKQAVGRVAQFTLTTGAWSYSNFTSRIRVLDERQLAADFLWVFLNKLYDKGLTLGMQSQTTGIRNLNLNAYRGIPVPLPPLSLQQMFSKWVSVEREIEARQSSSDEQTDALFRSMLHRAFEEKL